MPIARCPQDVARDHGSAIATPFEPLGSDPGKTDVSEKHRLPPSSVPRYEKPRPARYTISDLEREVGLSARTIRYYIAEGLLQPAYGRGPSATYDSDHLLRLRLIQQFKDERLPLTAIKERLDQLTPDDIAVMLKVQLEPSAETWRHFHLHEDLFIAVRDRSGGTRNIAYDHAFDLIVEYARTVLEDLERRVDE
ncbi:MAG TPA: MerR family transcriptional regulator [Thermomicrobiales bacterium]|nr:MerR family transcriptional regulator [Thermomicrobiales bacterium]